MKIQETYAEALLNIDAWEDDTLENADKNWSTVLLDRFYPDLVFQTWRKCGESVVIQCRNPHQKRNEAIKFMLPVKLKTKRWGDHLRLQRWLPSRLTPLDGQGTNEYRSTKRFTLASYEQKYISDHITEKDLTKYGTVPFVYKINKSPFTSISMEWVSGQSCLKWSTTKNHTEILEFFYNLVCLIEKSMHERGKCHCDLKPENVLVRNDKPVLIDFGDYKDMVAGHKLTQRGDKLGTEYTMDPRQRKDASDRDYQTDIFQLGICLWLMWNRADPELLSNIKEITEDSYKLLYPSEIFSPGLRCIFEKATKIETSQRYEEISEMRREIEGLIDLNCRPVKREIENYKEVEEELLKHKYGKLAVKFYRAFRD